MAGRKPLPTAIKEASGAYRKDPQRRNHEEPKPQRGYPEIPELIAGTTAEKHFLKICRILDEMNVLTTADGMAIEKLALLEMMLGDAVKQGDWRAAERILSSSRVWHAELGITPSSRGKLKVVEQRDDDNPMGELLRKLA